MGLAARPRRSALLVVASIVFVGIVVVTAPQAVSAAASGWTVGSAAGSTSLVQADALPGAPGGVTATCSLLTPDITVTWSAVPHATSYTVYQSTTAAGGPYSVAASGVTGNSWSSSGLALATFWYEVSATVGTNWEGARSAPTAGNTITLLLCL